MILRTAVVLAGSYLIGCFVAAYYLTLWMHGVDIRAAGSGNAGARNMARVYGMQYALVTFFIDAAKGILVVWGGIAFVGQEWAGVAALLAAMIGHIWPIQLAFHGGKGVATGLGGMMWLNPIATLALLVAGIAVYMVTRKFFRTGLAVIAITAPVLAGFGHDWPTVALAATTSLLALAANHPLIDAPRQPKGAEHLPE